MSKLDEALENLKQEIGNDSLIQEYFRLRNLITSSEEIRSLKKQIDEAQVSLSLSMGNEEAHAAKKAEYEQLVALYDVHPLISNFSNIQIEVHEFLKNIADLLE
ncbi:MAG: YlbF family regulator [Bacilli bacterium]|jgi:cell fate (sporulation/competence/biofilm development) regulator YmcA (YheA/YmcA/DUF963 family)